MKKELMFFRMAILLSVTSLLGFNIYSAYCGYKAGEARQSAVELSGKSFFTLMSDCKKRTKDSPDWLVAAFCDPEVIKSDEKMWADAQESAVTDMRMYGEKENLYSQLSYYIPLITIFLFYGGRWIILGKLRPLIPKK